MDVPVSCRGVCVSVRPSREGAPRSLAARLVVSQNRLPSLSLRPPPLPPPTRVRVLSLPPPPPQLWNPSRTRQRTVDAVSRWRYLSVHFPSFLNLALGVLAFTHTPSSYPPNPPHDPPIYRASYTTYTVRTNPRALLTSSLPADDCLARTVIPPPPCTPTAPVSSRSRRARLCSTATTPLSNHTLGACRSLEPTSHIAPTSQAVRSTAVP